MTSRTLVRTVHTTATETARVVSLADRLSVPDGGYTVDPRTGRFVTTGYAVAVYPDREQQISGRVGPADVTAYAYRNADVSRRSGVMFGGWRDPSSGIAYLDVSVVVASRGEAERLARRHNQLAYFDLASGSSVAVTR